MMFKILGIVLACKEGLKRVVRIRKGDKGPKI